MNLKFERISLDDVDDALHPKVTSHLSWHACHVFYTDIQRCVTHIVSFVAMQQKCKEGMFERVNDI